MPQLDTSTWASQIFWLLVSFLLLLLVVRTLAAPRLARITQERDRRTQGDMAAAEAARTASAQRTAECEAR
ncbi:MAG: ATPase, partial [Sphingomonadaceae bacterium]